MLRLEEVAVVRGLFQSSGMYGVPALPRTVVHRKVLDEPRKEGLLGVGSGGIGIRSLVHYDGGRDASEGEVEFRLRGYHQD